MANFDKSGMTQAGINLMGKAIGGATIQFTRLVLGDGTMTGEILDLQGVVSPKQNVDVTRIERNDNQCTVGGELLTSSVKQGFWWREIGLYAMDPDKGEILYNYASSSKPDWVADSLSDVSETILVAMIATIGTANVDITIADNLVFVTKKELGDISKLNGTTVIDELISSTSENKWFKSLDNTPKLICHRGFQRYAPENSIPAFIKASEFGYWGCETDVRITADNQFILMHDDTIDRTTNGTGAVSSLNLQQIREVNIDVGENINIYPNLKVPTLEEALQCFLENKLVPLLEIKGDWSDAQCLLFLNILNKFNLAHKCIIGSYYHTTLEKINAIDKQIVISPFSDTFSSDKLEYIKRFENGYISILKNQLTSENFELISKNDTKIGIYTLYQHDFYKYQNVKKATFITTDDVLGGIL